MAISNAMSVKAMVLEMLAGNPNLPYSTIGDKLGVTRERVRQIAKKNGYPARIGLARVKPKRICRICGKTFYTNNIYCSAECGNKARRKRVSLLCRQCSSKIERPPGSLRNKSGNFFCNRACYNKWISNNNLKAAKDRKKITNDLKSDTGSKGEIFLKGEIPASEILKIYNILLRLSERDLVKININGFNDFRELGKAIERKTNKKDKDVNNAISAIIDIKKHSLLFVMRLTD